MGDSTSDGGIVLDLSAMNAVDIDADRRTAWAQTGIKAGDYTRVTGERGLATGLGDATSVGLGGITLSGGMGFLVRKHGLTIDDVLAAEVVTANGERLLVDDERHADLFWALRGGGGTSGRDPVAFPAPRGRRCRRRHALAAGKHRGDH